MEELLDQIKKDYPDIPEDSFKSITLDICHLILKESNVAHPYHEVCREIINQCIKAV